MPGCRWINGWIAGAAFLAAVTVTPALAQVDQGRALSAIEAGRDIAQAISASDPAAAPRMASGEYKALFAEAMDLSLIGDGVQSPADIAVLIDLQKSAGAMVRAYLLLGIDSKSAASELSGGQAARNFVAFLPEMAALYDYRVRVGSAISQAAAKMPAAKPDPKVSLAVAAIATEQEKVLLSALAVASDQQIEAQWRAGRVRTLLDSVSGFTALVGRKKAQEIADTALIAARAESDPAVALLLKDFALALLR